ncbi:pumilio-family RNA-binding repeat protein (macronuclear) [Tetrahymena thermophila SB210]|uniref:Pumilio-family RNA-binding repeat protein n=1 Tax=Tetrahymena thermophila (strain SB210) TaxID=312017 RepID=I7M3J4_TETTS|nr:pumilio-family RNA-binding repeat protein [Tetrahymena thermophila SB210]EAS03253.2 pumilio-family RNA-binding repeat protein [Tetrahymena thermophila SB210]|eukprot:XP_001023498.2 pumilio-family RNA-binding repeat protein [Tetrahymena thermophila SB210]
MDNQKRFQVNYKVGTSSSKNAFGNGLFIQDDFKANVPADVKKIFSSDDDNLGSISTNQNDFVLSGFDEEENESESIYKTCSETLQTLPLQICPYCLKLVNEIPYKIVEFHKLKEKKFAIHKQCDEGIIRLKNQYEFVNTMYTFQQNEGRLFSSSYSQVGRPKLHQSHLIMVEIQHPISNATIFSIQQISDLYQSPHSMNNDYIKLNLNSGQLYQPQQYIVPIHIFSLRSTVINLEDRKHFVIDMVINLSQFEDGTELELKGRKDEVGELKVCGIVLEKNINKINSNKNNYQIPQQWFQQGTGNKCFEIFSIELDFIDPAIEKVRKTIQEIFPKLNVSNQPYTPPLSHGSNSPTFSPQRDMSPSTTGCTTPPHEQLTYSQIKGQIANKVQKNKEWSMAIQMLIKKSAENNAYYEIQAVIDEIKGRLVELMKHHYGNYFSKTLVQVCTMQQKCIILQEIKDMFPDISQDPQGTHAIQSLVETIKLENEREQILVIQCVGMYIIPMTLNPNATHVINKIVQNFTLNNILCIYDAVIKNFKEVVKNKQGVCIIKSLMNRFKDTIQKKQQILQLLKVDIRNTVIDKYGNYALQEAIKIYPNDETEFICDYVFENMIMLAQNQVSSNIVESVLQFCKKQRAKYIQKIMENMILLFNDSFGKFVIKRVINLVDVDNFQMLQFKQILNQCIANNPKQGAFYTNQKSQISPKSKNMLN